MGTLSGGGTPIYWLTACAARVGMLFDQALVSERVSYWGKADFSLSVGMLFDQGLVSERVSYWGRADVSLLVGVIIGIQASP